MNFNHNTFASELDGYTGISVDTDSSGNYDWDQWKLTDGDLNKVLNYSKSGYDYRTWYLETYNMRDNKGMVVTCKVDFERTTGDDHIIIIVGFGKAKTGPQMIFAQASVQFHGDDDDNIMTDPVYLQGVDTPTDFGQIIYDEINSPLQDIDFGNIDDSSAGRSTFPDIARANINSMINAVS